MLEGAWHALLAACKQGIGWLGLLVKLGRAGEVALAVCCCRLLPKREVTAKKGSSKNKRGGGREVKDLDSAEGLVCHG